MDLNWSERCPMVISIQRCPTSTFTRNQTMPVNVRKLQLRLKMNRVQQRRKRAIGEEEDGGAPSREPLKQPPGAANARVGRGLQPANVVDPAMSMGQSIKAFMTMLQRLAGRRRKRRQQERLNLPRTLVRKELDRKEQHSNNNRKDKKFGQ